MDAVLAQLDGLDDLDLLAGIVDTAARISALQAVQAAHLAELEARVQALGYALSGAADTIAVHLVISARAAEHALGDAVGLCARPVVWAALAAGRIDKTKASSDHGAVGAGDR